MRLSKNAVRCDDTRHATSRLLRDADDPTLQSGSSLEYLAVLFLAFTVALIVASCAVVGNETGTRSEPTERSFDSLSDYAKWCGKLRVDAPDYRTHGEMIDAIEYGLKSYQLATPIAELTEFHELRTLLTEMTLEMFSRHPRDGAPYDTIHMADEGAANFAYFANSLISVQGNLNPEIIDTLKADDCIR